MTKRAERFFKGHDHLLFHRKKLSVLQHMTIQSVIKQAVGQPLKKQTAAYEKPQRGGPLC